MDIWAILHTFVAIQRSRIMYEAYIHTKKTPAGKVLEHILRKANMSRCELATSTGIYPQHISALIEGTLRFTIAQSIVIEKALQISIAGFFYQIQTNYEIYNRSNKAEMANHPDLSHYSKALFWDVRMERINWVRNAKWIIQRVFEYGNPEEIEETLRFYGKETVNEQLNHIKSTWMKETRIKNQAKYFHEPSL